MIDILYHPDLTTQWRLRTMIYMGRDAEEILYFIGLLISSVYVEGPCCHKLYVTTRSKWKAGLVFLSNLESLDDLTYTGDRIH